jgi:hypothetical protein
MLQCTPTQNNKGKTKQSNCIICIAPNTPIKEQGYQNSLKNKGGDPALCCLQETHFKFKDTDKKRYINTSKIYNIYLI